MHTRALLMISKFNKMNKDLDFREQLNRIEAAAIAQKNVLTFEEACRYTGLSRSKMYKHTSARTIPHSKPQGKLVYFSRQELDKWLLKNPITITEQIENEAQKYCMCTKKGGNK